MNEVFVYILLFVALFFEVFVLLVFLEKRGEIFSPKKKSVTKRLLPAVTVMVPVFNEEKTVAKTLNSLLALDYPKSKLEILVINDGSTDNTQTVLDAFESHPCITLLTKENGGKHTALNYGLQFAKGDIVGCLDADSDVAPDALLHIVHSFIDDKEAMAVVPAIKVGSAHNTLQLTQQIEYTLSIFMRKIMSLIGSIFVTPGPFSFFRREVFSIVGPYRHAHNTEDLEICLRMQEHNMKIINAHEAVVYTVSPNTLKKLYKQRVRWIYGFLRNMKDYYRSFFFNPKHGNLGLFILPISTFSIYSAIYFAALLVVNSVLKIINKVGEYMVTGWHFDIGMPTFDFSWFYVSSSVPVIVSFAMIALVFCMLCAGLALSKEKFRISRGLIFYTFVYGFISTYWLLSASIKALLAKKPSWR